LLSDDDAFCGGLFPTFGAAFVVFAAAAAAAAASFFFFFFLSLFFFFLLLADGFWLACRSAISSRSSSAWIASECCSAS
jgi:hypothetical protein